MRVSRSKGGFPDQSSSTQPRSSLQRSRTEKSIPSFSSTMIRHLRDWHYRWIKSNLLYIFSRWRLNALSRALTKRFRIWALMSESGKKFVPFSFVASCRDKSLCVYPKIWAIRNPSHKEFIYQITNALGKRNALGKSCHIGDSESF